MCSPKEKRLIANPSIRFIGGYYWTQTSEQGIMGPSKYKFINTY